MKKNNGFLALVPLVAIAGVVALFQNKTFLFIFFAFVVIIVVVVAFLVARARRAASTVSAVPSASSTTIPVVSVNVPNYVRANSTVYLQDRLSKLSGVSVHLRIVTPEKARRPADWTDIRGDAVLVDENREIYGVLFSHALEKSGQRIGAYVDCLITRNDDGFVELWVPIEPHKLVEEKDSKFSVNIGGGCLRIPLPEAEVEYNNCKIVEQPVPSGSKAKPAIALVDENGDLLFEVGARMGAWKELQPHVGKQVERLIISPRISESGEEKREYFRCWMRLQR